MIMSLAPRKGHMSNCPRSSCLLVVAALVVTGCASTAKPADGGMALTDSSTCSDWAGASVAHREHYVATVQTEIPVPAAFSHDSDAVAYAYGYVGGHCHRAEMTESAGQTTLTAALGLPSPSSQSAPNQSEQTGATGGQP
jgi:hypothetical protein